MTRQLTTLESELVGRIADRAVNVQLAGDGVTSYRREDIYMDVAGCHKLLGLNLAGLADSDDFTFAHDVWGIKRHFDRDNDKMYGCFLPRTVSDEAPDVVITATDSPAKYVQKMGRAKRVKPEEEILDISPAISLLHVVKLHSDIASEDLVVKSLATAGDGEASCWLDERRPAAASFRTIKIGLRFTVEAEEADGSKRPFHFEVVEERALNGRKLWRCEGREI